MTRRKRHVKSILRDKLDKTFSRLVRISASDNQGLAECFTCRRRYKWERMHAGHWLGRGNWGTRWDHRNVKPQCARCNHFEHGRPADFEARLIEEGVDVQELRQLAAKPSGFTVDVMETMLDDMIQILEEVCEKKGAMT